MQKDDWKKIPINKDIIIITIDSKDSNTTFLYEVKHLSDETLGSLKINASGEVVDRVELIDITEKYQNNEIKNVGGRFGTLYKRFFN